MWIARDKTGSLYLFQDKPYKYRETWVDDKYTYKEISDKLFPEVEWSDEEPTEVEIVIKKK